MFFSNISVFKILSSIIFKYFGNIFHEKPILDQDEYSKNPWANNVVNNFYSDLILIGNLLCYQSEK